VDRRPPPALGEHTETVYGDLLGIETDELIALRAASAI
jgi:crotonobetainyl-CoA:carnitine CoA-transferase CaiB-like acyl-CoA transferase